MYAQLPYVAAKIVVFGILSVLPHTHKVAATKKNTIATITDSIGAKTYFKPVATAHVSMQPVSLAIGDLAHTLTSQFFGEDQWPPMDQIITRESGYRITARNPSGAYGICQALPAGKMATAGSDWATNPVTQITWCLSYVRTSYGTPAAAWTFWQIHKWF